jgi:hypothetical protein
VVVHKRHNGLNQRWSIVYVDKKKAGPSKGINKNFGFHINRPFYIISRLPMRRVIEVVGGRNVVLRTRHYNRKT